MPGETVYLLHFEERYKHAGHYIGTTRDLQARLDLHAEGRGARLMEVVVGHGISFTLARTWRGGRKRERQIKKQGGASRPVCHPSMKLKAN